MKQDILIIFIVATLMLTMFVGYAYSAMAMSKSKVYNISNSPVKTDGIYVPPTPPVLVSKGISMEGTGVSMEGTGVSMEQLQ